MVGRRSGVSGKQKKAELMAKREKARVLSPSLTRPRPSVAGSGKALLRKGSFSRSKGSHS